MPFHFHNPFRRDNSQTILRNFLFGVEDSLVSTVGLLAGIAAADISHSTIMITGLVLIVVEGFSMGIGSFLTEETAEEMAGARNDFKTAFYGGITMLISYILAGLIPLAPYLFIKGNIAIGASVGLSLLGLFVLGFVTARHYARPDPFRRAIRMVSLGGLAVGAGMLVGKIFHL